MIEIQKADLLRSIATAIYMTVNQLNTITESQPWTNPLIEMRGPVGVQGVKQKLEARASSSTRRRRSKITRMSK